MLSIPKYPEQYAQHFPAIFYLLCCASEHHVLQGGGGIQCAANGIQYHIRLVVRLCS